MKHCPLCNEELILQVEEFRSGDVIDEYCPTEVMSVSGRMISHFRTGGLVERTYGIIPPFRFWISPKNEETIFSAIGPKRFTQIMEKPLMPVEEAVAILKKIVNLKPFT